MTAAATRPELDPLEENTRIVQDLAASAVERFFADAGIVLSAESAERAESLSEQHSGFAGVIGFAGTQMRGNLAVCIAEGMVVASRPVEARDAKREHSSKADWTAEIANQVLGRVKNSLLKYGTEIGLSIPSAIYGAGYTLTTLTMGSPMKLAFSSEAGDVLLLLNLDMHEDLVLAEDENYNSAEEGELLLF